MIYIAFLLLVLFYANEAYYNCKLKVENNKMKRILEEQLRLNSDEGLDFESLQYNQRVDKCILNKRIREILK